MNAYNDWSVANIMAFNLKKCMYIGYIGDPLIILPTMHQKMIINGSPIWPMDIFTKDLVDLNQLRFLGDNLQKKTASKCLMLTALRRFGMLLYSVDLEVLSKNIISYT